MPTLYSRISASPRLACRVERLRQYYVFPDIMEYLSSGGGYAITCDLAHEVQPAQILDLTRISDRWCSTIWTIIATESSHLLLRQTGLVRLQIFLMFSLQVENGRSSEL